MKSKPKKITRFEKVDSYGATSFAIDFENGQGGYYSTKSPDAIKFVVGTEIEYNIEEKESKAGKKYFKITLPSEAAAFKPSAGRPQVEPRIQMISFAMAYAKDLVVAGKVDMKSLSVTFDVIYNEMISKL